MSMFLELKQALEEVRDYRAGRRTDLSVIRFKPPKSALVRSPGFASLCGLAGENSLCCSTPASAPAELGARYPAPTKHRTLVTRNGQTDPAVLLARV